MDIAEKQWRNIVKFTRRGAVMVLIAHLEQYTKDYPDKIDGWTYLVNILTDMTRYEDAQQILDKAFQSCRTNDHSYLSFAQGRYFFKKGDMEQAEVWYQKSLKENPNYGDGWLMLGRLYARTGNHDKAKSAYHKAIETGARYEDEVLFHLAMVYRAEKDYLKALEMLNQAIDINMVYTDAKNAKKDLEDFLNMTKD